MLAVSNEAKILVATGLVTSFRHPNPGPASSSRAKQGILLTRL